MACPMCPGRYYTAKNICGPKVNHHVIVWPYFGCFLKCKIANLAQNGTKLGRVGRPQCVGPKILGRGWTHQLPQASLERNLDICGPFFDVWFTKVETWNISKMGPRKVTLLQLRGGTKSDFAFVRPQLTQLTTQMQKSGQNWTFYGVFLKCKIAKIAKNST